MCEHIKNPLKTLLLVVSWTIVIFSGAQKAFSKSTTIQGTNTQNLTWQKLDSTPLHISSIETTPYGLILGEYDTRLWTEPFNGIHISKDLGETWQIHALGDRGVTDLKYYKGKIYATTYYNVSELLGLFVNEEDETWTHIGPEFSASAVDRDSGAIYLGGFSHGLWTSRDNGITWKQKLGHGWYGPEIYDIESAQQITLINSAWGLYKTTNLGGTLEIIDFFSGEAPTALYTSKNLCLVGTNSGLYSSNDLGITWEEIPFFADNKVTSIIKHLGYYYVGSRTDAENTIFVSNDLEFWSDLDLNRPLFNNISDITAAISHPSFVYALARNDGIYKRSVHKTPQTTEPFLQIPWEYQSPNELMDRLTAYFDHEYPLLGYLDEPNYANETTLNFLGIREAPPKMYYSGHSGSDFFLEYGTPVLAAHSGMASYYYCADCGHTIKIDHGNGFETVYMHLQSDDLVTRNWLGETENVIVETGQMIGRVGMTGNTSGPHLHFELHKDRNGDGNFSNELPFNRLDPFGWEGKTTEDPWDISTWVSNEETETGSTSEYLWVTVVPLYAQYITTSESSHNLDNKSISLSANFTDRNSTLFIRNGPRGIPPDGQNNLSYVENTSLMVNLLEISELETPATVEISITTEQLKEYFVESLKIYSWNNKTSLWEELPTTLEREQLVLQATTTHLSKFAVFGKTKDGYVDSVIIKNAGFSISF
jgi:murein DD-endopeptidase MepM/ murein hydrolase activator NlpD